MTINDGGPAFPAPWGPGLHGMTLRMYLAAEALKHPSTHLPVDGCVKCEAQADYIAASAFRIADAFLEYEGKSREQK